jgi:hypothetical protein
MLWLTLTPFKINHLWSVTYSQLATAFMHRPPRPRH